MHFWALSRLRQSGCKLLIQKNIYLNNMSCFWRTIIVCFTPFKNQFNPEKWKKKNGESEKLWSGKLGNMRYFYYWSLQKIGRRAPKCFSSFFLPKSFILKYFQKLMRFQLLLDQDIFVTSSTKNDILISYFQAKDCFFSFLVVAIFNILLHDRRTVYPFFG